MEPGLNIDLVKLNFNSDSLLLLNICLAIIMYGVALDLKISDFIRIASIPKPALLGIFSQFIALPALTFLLIYLIQPIPSIALGMMLVAACPGGNISNFMTHLAKGNAALSVTLTAFSTLLAFIMTPLNLAFWASFYPPTKALLTEISLDPLHLLETIALILGVPLLLGMLTNAHKPNFAKSLQKVLKPLSMLIFIAFVVIAFANNFNIFLEYFEYVVWIVLIHNAVALFTGYTIGSIFSLNLEDRKTLTIETGIQNSGLGLIIIFTFFNGMGGMAIVAAWWGIWHIISGLSIGYFWSRTKSLTPVRS